MHIDWSVEEKYIVRFWEKVNKTEACWEWKKRKPGCYPQFSYAEHCLIQADRFAWAITYGPIPQGLYVLHRCDNPGCVRPDHLFLGTQLDNMRDMREKGRAGYQRKAAGKPRMGEWVRQFQIRLSPAEREQVREGAESEGMTIGRFARLCLMEEVNLTRHNRTLLEAAEKWTDSQRRYNGADL